MYNYKYNKHMHTHRLTIRGTSCWFSSFPMALSWASSFTASVQLWIFNAGIPLLNRYLWKVTLDIQSYLLRSHTSGGGPGCLGSYHYTSPRFGQYEGPLAPSEARRWSNCVLRIGEWFHLNSEPTTPSLSCPRNGVETYLLYKFCCRNVFVLFFGGGWGRSRPRELCKTWKLPWPAVSGFGCGWL